MDINALTESAFEFGPFLFAILVLVYLTKRAHQNYVEVATRKAPRPQPEELQSRRLIYYLAWSSGFILVLISVAWWLFSHEPGRTSFVSFTIQNISEGVLLTPRDEDIYLRTNVLAPSRAGDQHTPLPLRYDYYFLVPIEGEIDPDRDIVINYIPSNPALETNLFWSLAALDNKRFTIGDSDGEAKLVPVATDSP